jgi:hypothetical protein
MHTNAASSFLARTLIVLVPFSLAGCSTGGAPSFDLFGAFFPAWLLCGTVGIAGAIAARVGFVSSGVADALPYQLAVCTAIGVIAGLLFWLVGFGH